MLNPLLNSLTDMFEHVTVTIGIKNHVNPIAAEVADTRNGISKDLRDKVFGPYFTICSKGADIGQALCGKVRGHRAGSIELNLISEGMVFTVSLPRNRAK